MPIEVSHPSGILEFPDGTSEDDILNAIRAHESDGYETPDDPSQPLPVGIDMPSPFSARPRPVPPMPEDFSVTGPSRRPSNIPAPIVDDSFLRTNEANDAGFETPIPDLPLQRTEMASVQDVPQQAGMPPIPDIGQIRRAAVNEFVNPPEVDPDRAVAILQHAATLTPEQRIAQGLTDRRIGIIRQGATKGMVRQQATPEDLFAEENARKSVEAKRQKVKDVQNTIRYLGALGANASGDVSEEDAKAAWQHAISKESEQEPPDAISQIAGGLINSQDDLLRGLATPKGAAMMGAAMLPVVGPVARAYFAMEGALGVDEASRELGDKWDTANLQDKTELISALGLNASMVFASKHDVQNAVKKVRTPRYNPEQLRSIDRELAPNAPRPTKAPTLADYEQARQARAVPQDVVKPETPVEPTPEPIAPVEAPKPAEVATPEQTIADKVTTLTPAVRAGGKIFKVRAHGDAAKAASGDAAALMDILGEKSEKGFLDQDNNWHSREEALPIAERLNGGKLPGSDPAVGLTSQNLDAANLLKHFKEPEIVQEKAKGGTKEAPTETKAPVSETPPPIAETKPVVSETAPAKDLPAEGKIASVDDAGNVKVYKKSGKRFTQIDLEAAKAQGLPVPEKIPASRAEWIEGMGDAEHQRLFGKPKEPSALQKSETGKILQREPSEAGAPGGERLRVESGEQGNAPARESAPEAPQEAQSDVRLEESARKGNMLEREASTTTDDARLAEILSESKGLPSEGRIANNVAHNPRASDATFKAAISNVEANKTVTPTYWESARKRREALQASGSAKLAEPPPTDPNAGTMHAGIPFPGSAKIDAMMDAAGVRLNNTRKALTAIFRSGKQRRTMDQGIDAADNMANNLGKQMGNRLKLQEGKSKLNREAAMAIIEANGDQAKLNDFLVKAQAGKNAHAEEVVRHAIVEWDNLQPLAERARKVLDDQITQENANSINTEYREGYVPHIYDMDLLMGAGRPFVVGGGKAGGLGSSFKKGRTFETIFDAIEAGYTPKSLDIADLAEHRVKVGQKLINRRAWADSLKAVNDPTDGKPLVTELETRTRGPGGTSYQVAPLGYENIQVMPGYNLAVHEGYAPLFEALTGTSKITRNAAGKLAMDLTQGVKHGLLLADTFHVGRVLMRQAALTGRIGYKKGLSLLEYAEPDLAQAERENLITPEMASYARQNRPTANLLLKSGLNVGRIQEALYNSMVRDIPGIGTFNKWVFEKMTRGAMLETAIIEFNRLKNTFPALGEAEIAQRVSRDINQRFGNLGRQGFLKSATMQDLARFVFLAPQWFEAMARSEARGYAQGAKGLTYDPVAHGKFLTGTMGKATVQGILAGLVATQLVNFAFKGHPTWQNEEEGHKMEAWIPDATGKTPGFWLNPLAVEGEMLHDVLRYSKRENAAQVGAHIVQNKLSPGARAEEMLRTGKDFDGTQVQDTWERAKRAGMSLAPAPIPLQPLVKGAGPGQFQRQLTSSIGLKTEPAETEPQRVYDLADKFLRANKLKREEEVYTPTEKAYYLQLRHALRNDDEKGIADSIERLRYGKGDWAGRPDKQIAKSMQAYAKAPFTGSKEKERAFYDSLSEKDQALYDKAMEAKAAEFERFIELFEKRPDRRD